MAHHVSRRFALKLAAGLAAVPAFARDTFAQAARARLRMTWWGGTDRAKRTQAALDAYQKGNPNIQIDVETIGWNDYWTRLATQVAGGNAPDVIQMDYRYIYEYARRKSLLPLDEFMPNPINIADFGQANIDTGKVDGRVYGVSMGVNSNGLFYDVTTLDRLKIAPPNHTTTWAQFAEMAVGITKAVGKRGYFGTADAAASEPALEVWVRQRGRQLYNAEGKLGFERDDVAEWFDYWDKLRRAGGAVAGDLQALYRNTPETDMLTTGRSAISFQHSNQLVAWQAVNQNKLGMTMFPQGQKPGQYYKPSMLLSLSATTPQPREAARVINFISTHPDAGAALGVERGVPPSKSMRDRLISEVDELGKAQIEYISLIADKVSELPPPPPRGAGEIQENLRRMYETISVGNARVPQAADQFIADARRTLERG
jgi:multiple sugar transport system substrate-binding protein